MNNLRRFSLSLFLIFAVLFCGCRMTEVASYWREREIVIDGKYADWGNAATYYSEQEKLIVNLLNDRESLYLSLITRNRELEVKIMESGLVVWFDPQGGRGKTLGIRFPLGRGPLEDKKRDPTQDWRDQEDKSGLIDREKERLTDKDFNRHLEVLEGLQERLEVFLAGKTKDKPDELPLEEAGKSGIYARIGRDNGYFVYELKIPLAKSAQYPYAIGYRPGFPVGLGIETGKFPFAGLKRPEGRSPLPGGRGPEDRWEGAGESGNNQEKLSLWLKVDIAER